MILQCPRCQTKWSLDDSLLRDEGSLVRCTRCGEEFTAYPPPPVMGALPDEPPDLETMPVDVPPPDRSTPQPDPIDRQDIREFLAEEGPASSAESLTEAVAPRPKKVRKRPRFRLWLILLLVLFIIIGGGVGAVLMLKNRGVHLDRRYLGVDLYQTVDRYLGGREGSKPAMDSQPTEQTSGAAEVIDTSYRRVDSASAGRLHIISGRIRNLTGEIMSQIRVEGVLLSRQGETVVTRVTYAGGWLDQPTLEKVDRNLLAAALEVWSTSGGPGINIEPDKTAPFMLIFFDVPREAKSYRVEVTSVRPGVSRDKPVGLMELIRKSKGDAGRISEVFQQLLGGK